MTLVAGIDRFLARTRVVPRRGTTRAAPDGATTSAAHPSAQVGAVEADPGETVLQRLRRPFREGGAGTSGQQAGIDQSVEFRHACAFWAPFFPVGPILARNVSRWSGRWQRRAPGPLRRGTASARRRGGVGWFSPAQEEDASASGEQPR